jgi:sec-independent protein translocase protein TatC
MSHDAMADKAAARGGGDEPEESLDDGMTLTEHLSELRSRIIRSALAVAIGMVLVVAFYDQVLDFLIVPYKDLCDARGPTFCDAQVYNFTPTEGLSTRLRVGMYGGIILALPVLLWQVWRFIVPALHAKERRLAIPFVLSSVVLFTAGGVLAYVTIGRALDFLISWAGEDVDQVFSVSSYVSLIGLMIFAFGAGFLLPVLLVFLQLAGVVTPRRLLGAWRYATVGIFVLAAAITPSGDPITLMMLGGPLLLLYFLAVLLGWLIVRRRPADD